MSSRTKIKMTVRHLAEIAEKSPGYTADIWISKGDVQMATDIAFDRRENGRRNKAMVRMKPNGRKAAFDSDAVPDVLD